MQHNNWGRDRDLLAEAYLQTANAAPPEDEANYSIEDFETEEAAEDELTIGGHKYEVGSNDPREDGIIIKIEKFPNGYMITGGIYSEPEDFVRNPENPNEGYGYALDLEGNPMDEDDLEDDLGEDGEDKTGDMSDADLLKHARTADGNLKPEARDALAKLYGNEDGEHKEDGEHREEEASNYM
tara:strand:- start:181 stop:729 length:549 start_codon:yes stop_codon:yes gene_type:complete